MSLIQRKQARQKRSKRGVTQYDYLGRRVKGPPARHSRAAAGRARLLEASR